MEIENTKKAIITSASNKYFPSLINFIGSIKVHYQNHPTIYVYDLGLNFLFKKEITQIEGVKILEIPKFTNHWRSCYTWKTYILNTPIADLNFYIDSGCQILKPLDEIFEKINTQGYLFVSQGKEVLMKDITPLEYLGLLDIDNEILNNEVVAAGIFGFKNNSKIKEITSKLYDSGLSGLCLGFSKNEQWKNKGVNKNDFVRDCKMFRHDTTLLSLFIYKNQNQYIIEDIDNFSGDKDTKEGQILWNMRMNYSSLDYVYNRYSENLIVHSINRVYIFIFMILKKINKCIKSFTK